MTLHALLAVAAAFVLVLVLGISVLRPAARVPWWVPALASAGFLGFSAYAGITEGPLAFWTEHTQSAWGNQIWFDLLFAAAVGWLALLPRLRAAGMRVGVWAIALPCGGSIAILAMVARLRYLEERGGEVRAAVTRRS
jgi:hypothetical protein